MKVASLKSGSRDGTLVVVKHDLSMAVTVPAIAATLIAALEDWGRTQPLLLEVARRLDADEEPAAFPLDIGDLASPLPRAPQFLDGSVYLHHMEKARRARNAAMPPNYKTEPLMYQGLSDQFVAPTGVMPLADDAYDLDYEAELAVVLDDVPMGVAQADASRHVKLVMLLNDYTLRALTKDELPKGFGFLQAKPTSSFAPVAVTIDELGDAWDEERFHLKVESHVNGRRLGRADAARDMFFTYPQLIAHAARTRMLSAGTVIGAGSISNADAASGSGCIAEARISEEAETGSPATPWLKTGDRIRIEAFAGSGESVFGAIDNLIGSPADAVRSHGAVAL